MPAKSAQADLGSIAARLAREHPDANRNLSPIVRPYTEVMSGGDDGPFFMALTLGLGFGVLLVACANVANLLLARAAVRTRETAIRAALGAGRRRLVTQQLVEALVLAAAGTALGLLIARAGIDLFNRAIADKSPPFWIRVALDAPAVAFAAGLTGLAAVLSGAVPAWRGSRADLNGVMKDGAGSGGLRMGRASRALVTAEIVLSFALLVAAGLMIRSITNLGTHRYGFATEDVFIARVVLPESRYPDGGSRARFAAAVQERIAAIPGVRAATLTSTFPGLQADRTAVAIDGRVYEDASHHPYVRVAAIAPRFLETFGRRPLAGREFETSDDEGAQRVAIVNASFAARFFPGVGPVGRRIRLGRDGTGPWITVVGVAPDLYMSGAENRDPAGVYVPLAQGDQRTVGVAVLTSGPPLALATPVRAQVGAIDGDLTVYLPNSLRRAIDDSLWAYRVFGPLMVVVGMASLFLSTVGLYSLMAFAMRLRTREIGLRMALGARPSQVARLVARQVGVEVGVGLLAGAALAAGLAQSMRALLFHVAPGDPLTHAAVAVTLVAAAGLAAVVPVRRATQVDPTVALRNQ